MSLSKVLKIVYIYIQRHINGGVCALVSCSVVVNQTQPVRRPFFVTSAYDVTNKWPADGWGLVHESSGPSADPQRQFVAATVSLR